MAPLTLHDAEKIREVIVDPIIKRLDERNQQLVAALAETNARVAPLEQQVRELNGLKAKVLFVATGFGLLAGIAWSAFSDWVKKHVFGISN